jgi:hypothetical protein
MRIHIAYADFPHEMNTSIWRCFIPYYALLERGHKVTISHYSVDEPDGIDAILIERNVFDRGLQKRMKKLKRDRVKVVVTFDDAYHLMPGYYKQKQNWTTQLLDDFRHGLELASVVIAPSELLCRDYDRYCKQIKYVPNYYDKSIYHIESRQRRDGFNIFWSGTTHYHSIKDSGVLDGLGEVCCDNRNMNVVVACPDGRVISLLERHVPHDQIVNIDLSKGAVVSGKVDLSLHSLLSWINIDHFSSIIGQFADLGIAPLCGEYDRRRSWVKAVDFAVHGLPFLATDYEPYQGVGATLVDNGNWGQALQSMVSDNSLRELSASSLGMGLAGMSIQDNIEVYEEVLGV